MTIPSTARKAGPLLGTGVQTAWPFTFKVFAAADVAVTIADSLGVETALVLDTDYSVTLNANQETSPGGTVTYPVSGTPLAVGSVLSIIGDLDYDQPLDLPSGGNFSPLALENQLDRTIMQVQQLREVTDRALLVPVTSDADGTLPVPEAQKILGWDINGTGLQNYDIPDLFSGAVYADWIAQTFTGTGSQTLFVLQRAPGAVGNCDVSVDGQTYVPNVDFSLSGATLTFTVAPILGAEILVRYGSAATQVASTFSTETQTATAGQTVFTLANLIYNPGANALAVYVNGLRMVSGVDLLETDTNEVTFTSGLSLADEVLFIAGRTINETIGAEAVSYLPAGTGAVATTVQTKLRETVSVKDFGADPAASAAANAAAIQAAADYCEANGYFLQGVPGAYSTNATIVLKCDGDLSAMTLNVDATTVANAVRVGPNSAGQYLFDVDLKLPFVNNTAKTGAGWVGFDTSIGVEIANVYQSRITVPSVYNFGIGLKEGGYGVGCAYNTIVIGVLFGNKINHQLKPGNASGWANQNTHIGGRFGHSSGEGTAVSGVMHIQTRDYDATGPGAPNNNLWLNPSVEGNEQEFHVDIQGSFNTFIGPRFETPGVPARVNFHAITANETLNNNLIGGYDIDGITYTFSGAGTSARNKRIGGTSSDSFEYSGNGQNFVNKTSSSRTAPHIQGFLSSATAIEKTNASTDWIYRLHGDGLSIKSSADTQDRIQMNAAGYLYFGRGSIAPTAGFRAGTGGEIQAQSILQPETDNATTLGAAAKRWSVVYAATGTINTSDAREKQQIRSLSDAENAVAVRLKSLIKAFKFNVAVQAKGDAARIHVGVIAQEVIAAFEAEGLDANRYAIVCYDEWAAEAEELAEDGSVIKPAREAGNRYGVRYEELLAFIISAL